MKFQREQGAPELLETCMLTQCIKIDYERIRVFKCSSENKINKEVF